MKPNILILLGFALLSPTYIQLLQQPTLGESSAERSKKPKFEVR